MILTLYGGSPIKEIHILTRNRSEGFPERDIWFLGMLDQGSARCPELLGNRRRHLIFLGGCRPPFKSAYRPP